VPRSGSSMILVPDRRYPWAVRTLLALALGASPPPAEAAPAERVGVTGPVSLRWLGPPECPERLQVLAQIEGYLGEGASELRGEPLYAEASIERLGPERWSSTLRLGAVTRHLEAESCAVLSRAIALVTAVHVDALSTSARLEVSELDSEVAVQPDGTTPKLGAEAVGGEATRETRELDDGSAEPRASAPSTVGDAIADDEPVLRTRPRSDRRSALRGLLRVEGMAGLGVMPVATGGVALAGGVSLRALRVEAGVELWPPREVRHSTASSITGSLSMLAGSARACWVPSHDRLEFPLCAGLRAGGMRGIGRRGVLAPEPAWGPWVDAMVEAAVVWSPIPALGLRLGAGAGLALTASRFHVGSSPEPLFRVPPVNARVLAGVEVYFARRRRPGTGADR